MLTDSELVAIWNAAPASDYGRIIKLLMLTGQRRDEIASLRWSEIDGDALTLPAERTKNARPHIVPSSPQARGVLDETPERVGQTHVFGCGKTGYNNFSRAKERLDEASGVQGWVVHDLRRTVATRMADLGVQPHVIEAVLNHVSGHKAGVAGIYNRSSYSVEKRAALDLWGSHIQTVLAQADGANVALLRKPALGGVA